MGADGRIKGNFTILDEPDQITYVEYIDKNPGCKYNKRNATDKANWRREQINALIILLKENIDKYNKEKKSTIWNLACRNV